MDSHSRESLPPLQRHQPHHHHNQFPPGMMMMMSPNSYTPHHHNQIPNTSTPSMTNNNNIQSFDFDGSDHPGGFSIDPAMKKKKRGRPRKYSPSSDGNIDLRSTLVTGGGGGGGGGQLEGFNGGGETPKTDSGAKKQRGRPPGSVKRQMDALGSPGVGFTPHVITVKAGEDIASKMTAFSQQGPRAVCILSANGAISNVTLRQPAMSGGTITYEGRFEIISLSGSFMLADSSNDNHSSRSSGLSVSLAGSDGRVLGGGVVGPLVAATPIQVVVGSFIAEAKKPKSSSSPTAAPPGNTLNFGGGGSVPGASPPSDGRSSESSEDNGSGSLHRQPGSYNNASQPPPPPQMPMYSNMGWPNSTMNMLRN